MQINGQSVEVPEGTTLLQAAQKTGAHIPTLCHAPGLPAQTSCMVCVVEERRTGRLVPSCSVLAEEGQDIWTHTKEVHEARRRILELLLSEHAGDCEAPCRRLCPAGLNIPLMLRCIARGEDAEAARIAAADLTLPLVLGWVCHHPCEAGCRRKVHDSSVAIREMHRQAADHFLQKEESYFSVTASQFPGVAVVGSGPAGLAAAWTLNQWGFDVHVFEKEARPGGMLRAYSEEELPGHVLDRELAAYTRAGIHFHCNTHVDHDRLQALRRDYKALVVACRELGEGRNDLLCAFDEKYPVRSVRSGKEAAFQVLKDFNRDEIPGDSAYDSRLGRITKEDIEHYMENRVSPEVMERGRTPDDAKAEAERCLHCDCHAPLSCKLRHYATEYEARPQAWRGTARPPVPGLAKDGTLLFDAGKCIKCGLCIEVAKSHGDLPGLSFTGRGFDTRVTVPFDAPLLKALSRSASECVSVCPTGALAFSDQEEMLS